MPIGLLEGIALGQIGIGALGSIFGSGGGDLRPEQRKTYKLLKQRLQGIDPALLERMKAQARTAIGNEASAISAVDRARLERMGIPVAKQQEVLAGINQQRFGATGQALLGIDTLNEQVKSDALSQLSGYASRLGPEPDTGQEFAQLLGTGIGTYTDTLQRQRYLERLDKLMAKYKTNDMFNYNNLNSIGYYG